MERIELTDCGVVFEPTAHTYHLKGKRLNGITTALHNQLAPDEFANIPKEVLDKATERGCRVHPSVQDFIENFNDDGSQELRDFIDLTMQYNFNWERSETLVTDFQDYASSIDLIARDSDDTISIGDIKTYGRMTPVMMMKLQYQLSTYAYMAEICWPGININRLFCIHIRNVEREDGTTDNIKEVIFIKRIDPKTCKALLQAELEGRLFENPLSIIPEDISAMEDRLRELIITREQCDEELAIMKDEILGRMEEMNIKTWTFTSGLKATRKLPGTRTTFDLARLKIEHPEIDYESYGKTGIVNGSLQLTL